MGNIYDDPVFFDTYAQMDRSRKGLEGAGEWHQLVRLFPDMEGKNVLDLGCGYAGTVICGGKWVGAVTAIDQSSRMIGEAGKRNADGRITYRVCALEDYEYPEETFDLVVSNLVLHYVEDLNGIYRKVYRTLKKGGDFLMNIEHPVFTGSVMEEWIRDEEGNALYWPVDDYFIPAGGRRFFWGKRW